MKKELPYEFQNHTAVLFLFHRLYVISQRTAKIRPAVPPPNGVRPLTHLVVDKVADVFGRFPSPVGVRPLTLFHLANVLEQLNHETFPSPVGVRPLTLQAVDYYWGRLAGFRPLLG